MRIKVTTIGRGLHPSEVVVQVKTTGGVENVVVDKRSLQSGKIDVGAPLARRGDEWLVELPRETMRGAWRIWVKRSLLSYESGEARVA
jgi:hypothetical protein